MALTQKLKLLFSFFFFWLGVLLFLKNRPVGFFDGGCVLLKVWG